MKKKQGFTLIELIMVIVILGILAAVAVPKFVDLAGEAEESSCKAIRGSIASACSIYYANEAATTNTAVFPSDLATAQSFVEGDTECPTATGQYDANYDSTIGKVTSCDTHGA